ncbi:MAG: iron ABC transporter permease [Kiritimatiellaeota bacterium]|nr:iron ABC transporter permease [Kiritimatiellota bacterium]
MKRPLLSAAIWLLPVIVLVGSLFIGASSAVHPSDVWGWILSQLPGRATPYIDASSLPGEVVCDVRLPRILLTFLVGASLAVSGTALQAVFRNPLVCPYILGLSSGAAFGAAVGLSYAFLPVQLCAFLGGLTAAGFSYGIARAGKQVTVVSLILAGIIVGGLFTAALTIVQFLTDPLRLQSIVHWTMGNLHNASWAKLRSAWPLMAPAVILLVLMRWRLNVLAMGDDEARAVGMNPEREKLLVLLPATLACSAAVAVAGVIGLFGLVVPHIVRMLVGADHRRAVPASFLLGGTFLLLVDDISRSVTTFELPIGVFTTLLGAPFFIFLLRRSRIGWES